MKPLLIRADAGARIGNGHFMRCLALAESWRAGGADATFLGQCENQALRERATSSGIGFISLASVHPDRDDLKQTFAVAEQMTRGTAAKLKPWVVLDGYHFDTGYQQAVRAAGYSSVVVDDINDRQTYHADILLNQNLGGEQLPYSCDGDTELLLGPRYLLLRHEFLAWKKWVRSIPRIARRVLLTMGGADPDNVTKLVLDSLRYAAVDNLEVTVVIGANNPHYDELNSMVTSLNGTTTNVRLIHNAANMPELMSEADIAVSNAGSTC
ncbi:MAG TPA: UDP-2,4-diacetamido-2,4,6-trideoxy-beta-L-altropyranose hydrolase, partial [Pyrinomonadaceae bacterium]|nr:UDP-2,4-diacetamido-2,4,6-trideoxy-beta-L-altropyranose hydrolase [Pyrinomonadaceae bacterium]